MKNIRNLLFVVMMAVMALSSCKGKDESQLSTDLVTSPKSATESSDKQAVIKFDTDIYFR